MIAIIGTWHVKYLSIFFFLILLRDVDNRDKQFLYTPLKYHVCLSKSEKQLIPNGCLLDLFKVYII